MGPEFGSPVTTVLPTQSSMNSTLATAMSVATRRPSASRCVRRPSDARPTVSMHSGGPPYSLSPCPPGTDSASSSTDRRDSEPSHLLEIAPIRRSPSVQVGSAPSIRDSGRSWWSRRARWRTPWRTGPGCGPWSARRSRSCASSKMRSSVRETVAQSAGFWRHEALHSRRTWRRGGARRIAGGSLAEAGTEGSLRSGDGQSCWGCRVLPPQIAGKGRARAKHEHGIVAVHTRFVVVQ